MIFNLLEEAVSSAHGESAWDDLLDSAGLEGAYTAVGTYPDEELMLLVGAASSALGITGDEVIRWFGRTAMPLLFKRYPAFFEGHESTTAFVLTLNDVIHPEVRKLFPGAYAPDFDFEDSVEGVLTLGYRSHRGLCALAEGLLEGAADHYGEIVDIEQIECTRRGGIKCVFLCRFRKADTVA